MILLNAYSAQSGALRPLAAGDMDHAIWIDLGDPTPEEIATAERVAAVKFYPPGSTDRFYMSDQVEPANGQTEFRALVLSGLAQHQPKLISVTFVRAGRMMATLSKGSPDGLAWLIAECPTCAPNTAHQVFPAILDMVIDYGTNVLDHVGRDLDRVNRTLFQHHAAAKRRFLLMSSNRRRTHELEVILAELGYLREVLVKLRRSVLSFRRLVGVLRERAKEEGLAKTLRTFEHELLAITEAQVDLSSTAGFMLDGAVGYITILQSKTINIMTVVGILLTPPVLIASIYGMNFKNMPELQWEFGYVWALGLMVVSTIAVYLAARAKGWL